jgi:hypothetical protein
MALCLSHLKKWKMPLHTTSLLEHRAVCICACSFHGQHTGWVPVACCDYDHPMVKQGREQALQNHCINNVVHLGENFLKGDMPICFFLADLMCCTSIPSSCYFVQANLTQTSCSGEALRLNKTEWHVMSFKMQ